MAEATLAEPVPAMLALSVALTVVEAVAAELL